MLTRADLQGYKDVINYNLGQAEKDYVQHVLLRALYGKINDVLVFKGGTCMQKTFGLERFSEDLDFTAREKVGIERVMESVAKHVTIFGYETELRKEKEDELSMAFLFKSQGPLFDGREKSRTYTRFEISTREEVHLTHEIKIITPIYHDLPPYTLVAMQMPEILAEKMRAIVTRDLVRDVYDVWFLFRKNVALDMDLVTEKMKYYKINFDEAAFARALEKKRRNWDAELKPLIARVPDFEKTKEEILEKLK